MKSIAVFASILTLVACANRPPDSGTATTVARKDNGDPEAACSAGAGSTDQLFGTYTVDESRKFTVELNEKHPQVGESVEIGPSTDLDYACVVILKSDPTKNKRLRLAIDRSNPNSTEIDEISHFHKYTNRHTFKFRLITIPPIDGVTRATGMVFYDDTTLSGDSGGTWGGGK